MRYDCSPTLAARFWPKVNKDGPIPAHRPDLGPCWLWTASLGSNGYGQIGSGGTDWRPIGAHCASWLLHVGPIPDGLSVLHHCDVKRCVNPPHLFVGTAADNAADMWAKGRGPGGDRNGSRIDPSRLRRGERHPARIDPSYLARGERQGSAKLTAEDVVAIRSAYAGGARLAALSRRFKVTERAIRNVVTGKTWRHIEGADPLASPRLQHASSRLPGVGWHKQAGKWRARVRVDGQTQHLGLFPTEEEAARAIREWAS